MLRVLGFIIWFLCILIAPLAFVAGLYGIGITATIVFFVLLFKLDLV